MADRTKHRSLFGDTLNPDGSLRSVSPSAIGTFKRCGLRWHFSYVERLQKKPMGKGAAIGDAAHRRLETFLESGQDVRGPLELVGAKMLEPYLWAAPANQGPGLVEGPLLSPRLQTPGGVLLTGYFDYYVPGTPEQWPVIIDHKFKKDLKKWGYWVDDPDRGPADAETLRDDPQTLTYGAWALAKQPTAPGVIVRQHQHQTEGEGGRFPLPAEVRLTRDDLLRRWGALTAEIDGPMVDAARVPAAAPGETPDGVPYNDMACGDFGGCDFARNCKHSPSNRFATLLRGSASRVIDSVPTPHNGAPTMSLLTQVLKPNVAAVVPQTAVAAVPQTVQAPASTQGVTNESSGHPGVSFMTDLKIDELKTGTVYLIPGGGTGKFEAMLGSRAIFRAKDGGLREVAADATVKTVDEETACLFEGRPFVKIVVPEVVLPKLSAAKIEKKRSLLITEPSDPSPVTPPDVAPPVAVGTVFTGPADGKAVAVTIETVTAPEVKVTTAEAIAKEPPSEKKSKAKASKNEALDAVGGDRLFLLVNSDCAQATDLSGYVKGLCEALALKHGTPDIRLARKESDLAFGGWKACLAIEVAKNPPKGLCSIRSGELADPVIETLVPIAALVVRGGVR